jgi:hypothetical protein
MSVSSSVAVRVRAQKSVARRACFLRCLALLLTLFGILAQHRVLTPTLRPSTSVIRQIAERAQSRETHALRAEQALRVAAAPVFARVPSLPVPFAARRWPRVAAALAPAAAADPSLAYLSHFHSKRRIPRMNSEEPPRV